MQSKINLFFIQVPPPFEKLAIMEAKEKYLQLFNKELECLFIPGGFAINLAFKEATLLNHYLKIPTRILLVIKSFKCRDFPKLYKQVSKIRWKDYFADAIPKFKISTKTSRLLNSTKIEQTLLDAFKRSHIMYPISKKDKLLVKNWKDFNLFIQVKDDLCTLSVDTTGKRLSLRNQRTKVGTAPIRENLAAALFYSLTHSLKGNFTLIDPMCGSGIFLLEAFCFFRPVTKRQYSFNYFPKYNFQYQLNPLISNLALNLIANDIDLDQLNLCKDNLKSNNLSASFYNLDILNLKDPFEINKDFPNIIMITNPPYGKRIHLKRNQKKLEMGEEDVASINFKEFEKKLIKNIHQFFPKAISGYISTNNNTRNKIIHKFKNGGIKLIFCCIKHL